jgi:hypothetical protein
MIGIRHREPVRGSKSDYFGSSRSQAIDIESQTPRDSLSPRSGERFKKTEYAAGGDRGGGGGGGGARNTRNTRNPEYRGLLENAQLRGIQQGSRGAELITHIPPYDTTYMPGCTKYAHRMPLIHFAGGRWGSMSGLE